MSCFSGLLTWVYLHCDRERGWQEDVIECVRVADDGIVVEAVGLNCAKVGLVVLNVLEADAAIRSFVGESHVVSRLDADLLNVRQIHLQQGHGVCTIHFPFIHTLDSVTLDY